MVNWNRIAAVVVLAACAAAQAIASNVFVLPANAFDATVAAFSENPFQSAGSFAAPPAAHTILARPDGSRYYVISAEATDTVLVLNSARTNVLKRIDLGAPARAAAISPDGRRLVVLAGGLYIFDITSAGDDDVTPSPRPDAGTDPDDVAFSLDSSRAYIVSAVSGTLTRLNMETGEVVDVIGLEGRPSAVAAGPSGVLYVSATNRIYDVDPGTGAVRAEMGVNGKPGRAAFTPDGRYALFANDADFVASGLGFLVNVNERAVAGVIPRTWGSPELTLEQLAVVDNNTCYAVSSSTRQLVRITLSPLAVHTTAFPMAEKTNVRGLAASRELPEPKFLFVAAGTSAARSRIATGDVENQGLPVSGGRVVLAGAASTAAPSGGWQTFGDDQVLAGGSTSQPLILRIWGDDGLPVFGKAVTFSADVGGVTFQPAAAATSLDGFAVTRVTVPETPGVITISAEVDGAPAPVVFHITVAGGGAGATAGLIMVSGNGQVVPRGWPTEEPLRVRLLDPAGRPIAGAMVQWAVESGEGSVWPQRSETDIDGYAETKYTASNILSASTSWLQSTVSAAVAGFEPVTFYVTAVPTLTSGRVAQPTYTLVTPPVGEVLRGRAGQTLAAGIKVTVKASSGTQSSAGIPNIGVRLIPQLDPATNPSAACAGAGDTALSDATGTINCNVVFGGVLGGPVPITVRVGGGGQGGTSYTVRIEVDAGAPGRIDILGGNGQSGAPGAALATPLSIEVSDGFGHTLAGEAVTWESVTPGGVTFLSAQETTDAGGRASATVQLGGVAGQYQVRVRAGSAQAVFNLYVVVPVSSLVKIDGDLQSAQTGEPFARRLVVEVRNDAGAPVSGAVVTFTVTSGSAVLGSASATTGPDGRASTTVTAGAVAGPVAVQASAAIEGRFTPVRIRGEEYVDPDWTTPLPVRLARALGATHVLAVDATVHLDTAPAEAERFRSGDLRKMALVAADAAHADLVLKPDFGYWVNLSQEFRERAIAAGYSAAMAQASALRRLHGV